MHVFISYRRSDTQSASRQLAEALTVRFGPDGDPGGAQVAVIATAAWFR